MLRVCIVHGWPGFHGMHCAHARKPSARGQQYDGHLGCRVKGGWLISNPCTPFSNICIAVCLVDLTCPVCGCGYMPFFVRFVCMHKSLGVR